MTKGQREKVIASINDGKVRHFDSINSIFQFSFLSWFYFEYGKCGFTIILSVHLCFRVICQKTNVEDLWLEISKDFPICKFLIILKSHKTRYPSILCHSLCELPNITHCRFRSISCWSHRKLSSVPAVEASFPDYPSFRPSPSHA